MAFMGLNRLAMLSARKDDVFFGSLVGSKSQLRHICQDLPPTNDMSSYSNSLSPSSWDGSIGSIRIRWSSDAPSRIEEHVGNTGVPVSTIKAMSEHFAHATAQRIGSDQIVIHGSPHRESLNSATGEISQDDLHISATATGGGAGQNKVHIYLSGVGQGPTAYNNVRVRGETVLKRNKKKGYTLDQANSYGSVSLASGSVATTTNTSGGSGTQSAPYSDWTLDAASNRYKRYNYARKAWEWTAVPADAGGSQGASSSSGQTKYSGWQLDTTYNRYRRFNHGTQKWEWQ
ncbi:hypothetical protein J7337_006450 [Fusarium musae]|uniref:Uncharacterized protein n=1 Tax=Fusarium musae TaxID=1042133 RepID=A0A9P8DF03_9HYPO|nr:hypothetical protein J7337_006450 [Fusarium musae]KAG9500770.1 hypothetical protein J7337_006450 [Fusarium musae]